MKKIIAALLLLSACDLDLPDTDCESVTDAYGRTLTICCEYDPETGEELGCTESIKEPPRAPIPVPVTDPKPYCYYDPNDATGTKPPTCYANPR